MILSICVILETVMFPKSSRHWGWTFPFHPCIMHDCLGALCEFWYPFPSLRSNNTRAESLSLHLMLASKAILAVLLLEVHFCQTEIKKRGKDFSEEEDFDEGSLNNRYGNIYIVHARRARSLSARFFVLIVGNKVWEEAFQYILFLVISLSTAIYLITTSDYKERL